MKNRKAQALGLAGLGGLAILLVIGIVTAAVGARVVARVDSTFTAATVESNISRQGNQGMQQWAEFFPIIGLVVVAAVVLSVIRAF